MKIKIFTIILIATLLLVSFFIFNFVVHGGEQGCFVSSIPGNDCPSIGGIMAIALHHIAGIYNLMLMMASFEIFLLTFSAFFIFLAFIILKFLQNKQNLQYFSNKACRRIPESIFIQKNRLLDWLSLSYKRDPHLFFYKLVAKSLNLT